MRSGRRRSARWPSWSIPIGDAIIVLRSNGPKATAYGVHGATTVVVSLAAAALPIHLTS